MKIEKILLVGVLCMLAGENPVWGQISQAIAEGGAQVLPRVLSREELGRAILGKLDRVSWQNQISSFPLRITSGFIPFNSRVIFKDPMWTAQDFSLGISLTARVNSASDAIGKQLLINQLSLGVREHMPSMGMIPARGETFDVPEAAFLSVRQSVAKQVLLQNQYLMALTQVRRGINGRFPVETLQPLTQSVEKLTTEIKPLEEVEQTIEMERKLYVFRDTVYPREPILYGAPAYSSVDAAAKQVLLTQERNRCLNLSQLVKRYQQTLEYLEQKQAPAEQITQYQSALNDVFVYYEITVARWLAVREGIVNVWPVQGIRQHLKEALDLSHTPLPSLQPMNVASYDENVFHFSSQDYSLMGNFPVTSMEEGLLKQELYERVISFRKTQQRVLEDKINKLKMLENRVQDPIYQSQLLSLSSLEEPSGWMAMADTQDEKELTQDIQTISASIKNTPLVLHFLRQEIKKGTPLEDILRTLKEKYQLEF